MEASSKGGEEVLEKVRTLEERVDLEKVRCQLAREKELERLRQAVKEPEKKLKLQMEGRNRERLYLAKQFYGKIKLLAKRKQELEDASEQVEMLRGELARCRAAPGGSWSRTAPRTTPRPSLAGPSPVT